jgi:hypothetical protein
MAKRATQTSDGYPTLVCPKCGDTFDARSPDAAAILRGTALPCNECIRYTAGQLWAILDRID